MTPSRSSGCSSKTKIRVLTALLPVGHIACTVWCGVTAFCHFGDIYVKPVISLARRASRIVDVDEPRLLASQRASRWASELLEFITARPKHREQTARSTHVPCANNHEIRLAATQILFDFWKPVAISSV